MLHTKSALTGPGITSFKPARLPNAACSPALLTEAGTVGTKMMELLVLHRVCCVASAHKGSSSATEES